MDKTKYRQIYKRAWKTLRIHYFLNVVIVFIVGVVVSEGYTFLSDRDLADTNIAAEYLQSEDKKSNAEILEEFVKEQKVVDIDTDKLKKTTSDKYTMGYFSVIVNEVTASGSLGFGLLNGINKIIFHGKIGQSVVIFVMTLLSALFWIFVKHLLLIGRCRFFMERRLYRTTKFDRILFIYRTGSTFNCAKIMLIRSVRQTLWNLTIVGGFIKHYEYLMIPYILAENPTIGTKEAFALSKELMMRDKRRTFLVDLSLLPINLLNGAAFNLVSLFFLDPYKECLFAELYSTLRDEKREGLQNKELLYDRFLSVAADSSAYPDTHCPTPHLEKRKWLTTDYEKDYGGDTPILFFFFFSLIGWVWEIIFYLMNEGSFINRGTLYGPWLPIYGVGGWIIIYGLKPLRKNPPLMFAGAFTVCGAVEYFTSWLLEKLFHQRWWDYTGYFMNLNGRICLEGLLVFGLAGVAMTYFIAPVVDNLLAKIPKKVRKTVCTVLIVLFFADCGFTLLHPHTGDGITEGFH